MYKPLLYMSAIHIQSPGTHILRRAKCYRHWSQWWNTWSRNGIFSGSTEAFWGLL